MLAILTIIATIIGNPLVTKAVQVILPLILELVKNGTIKTGDAEEVMGALAGRIAKRSDDAAKARLEPHDITKPDPYDRDQNPISTILPPPTKE